MKNKVTGFMILALAGFFNGWLYAAADPYEDLADKLSAAGEQLVNKKMAIIPFSYADETSKSRDGAVISERLTMKMINLQKFEIIERSVLDKVMNELKLQSSGVIDASTAKQLGKVLGVDAIITGTLVRRTGGDIEVNARIIKTETAQAIGAAQIIVKKDWIGGDTVPVQQPKQTYTQPQQTRAVSKISRTRRENEYRFFDIVIGFGSKNVNITYSNANANIYTGHIGFIPSVGGYSEIKMENMKGAGPGPIGFRVGSFGNKSIGGDFEFSVNRTRVEPQTITLNRDGSMATYYSPSSENYLTMTSIGFSVDLLIRHIGKEIDPYFGLGLGLSLNEIELPFAYGYTNGNWVQPVNDFGLGLMFRIPVGMRIKMDNTQFFAELRYELNHVMFDRDVKNEDDTISVDGVRFVMGVGWRF